jgi:thymidylate synthase
VNRNYIFRDVSEALPVLLADLLREGEEVPSRAGLTKEFTHVGITLTEPQRRELLVAHRRPNIAAQIAETAWVLAGRDDVSWLKHYLPRATDFSDDGLTWRAAYGPRLRDQLDYVVDLLSRDPMSRQAVIALWYPNVDSQPGKDIACNNWLHFLQRDDKLHLHVGIRSNDIIWGWSGINTFEWSVLLEVVACLTDLEIGSIHYSVSSEHIYEQHWKRADQICSAVQDAGSETPGPAFGIWGEGEEPVPSPLSLDALDDLLEVWFAIESDLRRGISCRERIDNFPEEMLQSWLRVLEWWWTGDHGVLRPLAGTRLEEATHYSIQPPPGSPFIRQVIALHNEKSAAYGDSWCRRGETLGILANIARKVDRLSTGGETTDETQVDTAIDLLVYLAKYRAWLSGSYSDSLTNEILLDLDKLQPAEYGGSMVPYWFQDLEQLVAADDPNKPLLVEKLSNEAYALAHRSWVNQP